ncbi:hypothetical protein PHET_00839 [Paragonimus heterotremus]|uniref:Uncharacterized protein n=1 Tax=Paragonimus heterotremus TaxID=100268 RepID=A0A8J4ST89_9TREM|nr:hypothetical protein PHET_00839 [Paragonimus heterotremus]
MLTVVLFISVGLHEPHDNSHVEQFYENSTHLTAFVSNYVELSELTTILTSTKTNWLNHLNGSISNKEGNTVQAYQVKTEVVYILVPPQQGNLKLRITGELRIHNELISWSEVAEQDYFKEIFEPLLHKFHLIAKSSETIYFQLEIAYFEPWMDTTKVHIIMTFAESSLDTVVQRLEDRPVLHDQWKLLGCKGVCLRKMEYEIYYPKQNAPAPVEETGLWNTVLKKKNSSYELGKLILR